MPDMAMARTQPSPRCCCTSSVELGRLTLDVDTRRSARCRSPAASSGKVDVHDGTDDLNDCACCSYESMPSELIAHLARW